MANVAGRLPATLQNNPLAELQIMMISTTASSKYGNKIGAINTAWKELIRKYNLYGSDAALARIMYGSLLKFQPRPGGGVVPCSSITSHLETIATRAGRAAQMANVITEMMNYAKNAGWCTEAGGTPQA